MNALRHAANIALKLVVPAWLMFFCGCLAPLSSNFTGRSLGSGRVGLDGGAVFAGNAIPSFKLAVGLGSNFDLGAQYDGFSLGLFGKASFINNRERGFSLAGVVGAGVAVGGAYGYAGPVLSYKAGAFEPYLVGRLNFVSYGSSNSSSGITWEEGSYAYFQFTLGSVLWLARAFGLNVEGSLYSGASGLADFGGFTFLAGAKVRF